jgi:protein-tyrosine phosphatase
MAREAVRQGIREIVCTPHLLDDDASFLDTATGIIVEVAAALERQGIDLTLHLGFELDFYFALCSPPESLARFSIGRERKTLIIEMPYDGWLSGADEALFRLRLAGYLPVLAHPERSSHIQRHPELLEGLLHQGVVAQCTVPSLLGDFGAESRRVALQMLSLGNMHLLATDAHYFRPHAWGFEAVWNVLERQAPKADTASLVEANPRALLEGRPLVQLPPVKLRGRWGSFTRGLKGS